MKRNMIGPLLSTWLLAASLVTAQEAKPDDNDKDKEKRTPRTTATKMYEDIEIMRRLLSRKLQPVTAPDKPLVATSAQPNSGGMWGAKGGCYGGSGGYVLQQTQTGAAWKETSAGVRPLNLEGVYVKDQGVIYTVTLPPSSRDPSTVLGRPAPKTLSEWDRMRKEVRHEKVEPADKSGQAKRPSVAETVLKTLAENGHHFTRLDDKETLTVVVTFRASPSGNGPWPALIQQQLISQGAAARTGAYPDIKDASYYAKGSPSVRSYELLGDLHLRHGRANEALPSYGKALEMAKSTPKEVDAKQVAAIYSKVAQAYLALKQNDQAQKAVEFSLVYLKKSEENGGKADKSAKGKTSSLPAKLIITASKKLLDQAGAGKMTFAEFAKEAKVEYLTFSAKTK
jgi:hypothetical protein